MERNDFLTTKDTKFTKKQNGYGFFRYLRGLRVLCGELTA